MKLEAFVSPLHIYAVYLSKKPIIFVFLHLNFGSEDVRKKYTMNIPESPQNIPCLVYSSKCWKITQEQSDKEVNMAGTNVTDLLLPL